MLKRMIFFILLMWEMPVFADGFGANDKVLFFKSDVLIDAIKQTFDDDNNRLMVAQTYVDVMDDKGNVSVNDLSSVCIAGGLNRQNCGDFIRLLIKLSGDDTVKTFFWKDYIGKGPVTFAGANSIDGYFYDYKSWGRGVFGLKFGWTTSRNFSNYYPGSNAILGISACTNDIGTQYVADSTKHYSGGEMQGDNCWCKMTGPEETPWVYLRNTKNGGGCARSCAVGCLNALYGDYTTDMQSAMFTAVKLSKSIANITEDPNIKGVLDEFKSCEFDWTEADVNGGVSGVNCRTKPPFHKRSEIWDYLKYDGDVKTLEEYKKRPDDRFFGKTDGLKDGQWGISDFKWFTSQEFQCKYPNIYQIKGSATCNGHRGVLYHTTNENFKENQANGVNCWCKMTYPEESKWVNLGAFDTYSSHDNLDRVTTKESVNGAIVKETVEFKSSKKSSEEMVWAKKADVAYCDSVCLAWCAQDTTALKAMFKSIGKK